MTRRKYRRRRKKYRINLKKFVPFILILILIIFLLSRIIAFIKSPKKKKDDSLSYLTASEISAEDKVKDLDYLASIVKNSYIKYDFVDIEKRKVFEEKLSYYKNNSQNLNDIQFRAAISEILSSLGDEDLRLLSKNDVEYFKSNNFKDSIWGKTLSNASVEAAMKNIPLLKNNNSTNKNINSEIVAKEISNGILYIRPSEFYKENINSDLEVLKPFYDKISNYKGIIIDISNRGGSDYKYFYDIFLKPLSSNDLYAFLRLAKRNEFFSSFGNDFNKIYKEFYSIKEEFRIGEIPSEVNIDNSIREKFKSYYRLDMNSKNNSASRFKGEIYLVQNDLTEGACDLFAFFSKSSGFASLVGSKSKGGLYTDVMPQGIIILPESKYPVGVPFVVCLGEKGAFTHDGTDPQIEMKIDSNAAYINTLTDIINSN